MLHRFIYFEKNVSRTVDKKKKEYAYGTVVIRSRQLNELIGNKVRVIVVPLDPKIPVPWAEIEKRIAETPKNSP